MTFLALATCPPHAHGFRAYLEALAAKGELPPRLLPAHVIQQPKEKGPNGRPLCRWCHAEVSHRVLAYCSDECRRDFHVRMSGPSMLWAVERRDKGVCSRCAADAGKVERILRHVSDCRDAVRLIRNAWGRDSYTDMRLWEADHIVPVWKGGGCTGVDNFRTLCRPCHVIVTREQAGERAAARRPQQALAFEEGASR